MKRTGPSKHRTHPCYLHDDCGLGIPETVQLLGWLVSLFFSQKLYLHLPTYFLLTIIKNKQRCWALLVRNIKLGILPQVPTYYLLRVENHVPPYLYVNITLKKYIIIINNNTCKYLGYLLLTPKSSTMLFV